LFRFRKRLARRLKNLIRERAQGYCEYCICSERYATERFSAEHIIPLAAGGTDGENNLALAFQGCNGAKHDKISALDPATEVSVPLYHPCREDWLEHF
jgi:5-methylcytosine-specific restriction endonuclease McrA